MKEEFIYGRNSIIELFKSGKLPDRLFILHGEVSGSLTKIIAMAKENNVEIKTADRKKLDELSNEGNHQGVVALINGFEYSDLEETIEKIQNGFILILDGIEDPHNLGAIIRTAECAGVDLVIIPKRRSAQVNDTVNKVSAGATEYVKVARVTNLTNTIKYLKEKGYWVYGADMNGSTYYKDNLERPIALVIGAEGNGISRLVKENLDGVLSIPLNGKISSLNASVAASILMYEIVRQENCVHEKKK